MSIKNTQELTEVLLDTIERVRLVSSDPKHIDSERAKSIGMIAKEVIEVAKLEIEASKTIGKLNGKSISNLQLGNGKKS